MVLNNDYSIHRAVSLETKGPLNTHELNFVDNGTRAIFLKNGIRRASSTESESVGYDGECITRFDGFRELDVTQDDWPIVFEWTSFGRVGLEESTYLYGSIENRCKGWDYL